MSQQAHIKLDDHSARFISEQIKTGMFNTTEEVLLEAIRIMEKQRKLELIRTELAQGEAEALRGEFVDCSINDLIKNLGKEGDPHS